MTPDDFDDGDFGRTLGIGAIIGIPVTFIVLLAAMVIVIGEPGVAPAIGWTALVGGGYFGGFVALNLVMAEVERRERAERRTARPAASSPAGRQAA